MECGYSMKTFDLEKLQSFTLSGEKITKEIFDALFLNQSPYSYNPADGFYPYKYHSATPQLENTTASTYQNMDDISVIKYEIFRGAFETAANPHSLPAAIDTTHDYSYCDNRLFHQNYYQSF